MQYIILSLISYLYGSFPFAYLAALLMKGKDLRKEGSLNVGVTNAYKVGGTSIVIITLTGEISKAFLSIFLGKIFFQGNLAATLLFIFCAFLGSTFSIFLKFKGSKGSTIMMWSLLILSPLSLVIVVVIWFIVYKISGYYHSIRRLWLPFVPLVIYFFERDLIFSLFGLLYSLLWYLKSLKSIDDLAYFGVFQNKTVMPDKD